MFDLHLAGKRGKKIVAVAEIGSASAAVAFLALEAGSPARVLAAERSILPIEERSKEATIAAIGDHLLQAGEKAAKAYAAQAHGSAVKLYCIIRAPWTRSRAAGAQKRLEQETRVTESMVAALAKEALGNEHELDRANFLEASAVRVELNGYPTGSPAGKRAEEVSVTTLVSDCDPQMRAQAQASLQKLFPHLTPVYRSSARALITVLRERSEDERDFVIADMAGESTSIISVRDGVVAEQYLVGEGVRGILKRIAPSGMPEETLNLLRMLERDQCSTSACEALRVSLAKTEPELVRLFGEGLAACASLRRLPNKLTLIAQPDFLPWLTKFFSRIDFTQFTLTTQPFVVDGLMPKDLSAWVVPARGVVLDMGLALSTALVRREEGGV